MQKVVRQVQLNTGRKHLKKEKEQRQQQKSEHRAGFSPLLLLGVAGLILAPILRASLDGFQKIAPILNVICIAFILAGLILAYGRQKKVQEAETEAAEEDAGVAYGDEEVYQKAAKQLASFQQKKSALEQQIETFQEQKKALQMQEARQEGSGDQIIGQIQEKEVEAANLTEQLQELQFQTAQEKAADQDIQALALAADTMQRLASGMSKTLEHVLNREMSEILSQITGNAHGQLQVSEEQGIVLSEHQKEPCAGSLQSGNEAAGIFCLSYGSRKTASERRSVAVFAG